MPSFPPLLQPPGSTDTILAARAVVPAGSESSDTTTLGHRQCFHSLSRRCCVSVQNSHSCSGAWGCCPSLQPSAPAGAAPALGLSAEQKPLECPMWRIRSASTFCSSPWGSAGAAQAGWWHWSRALEKVAPAGSAPGAVGAFAVQVLQPCWAMGGPSPPGELLKGCFSLIPCRLCVKNAYYMIGSLQILK